MTTQEQHKNLLTRRVSFNKSLQNFSEDVKLKRLQKVQYDRLEAMRSGVHSRLEIEGFDGGLQTVLRLLSVKEQQDVRQEAHKNYIELAEVQRLPGIENEIFIVCLLQKASTSCPEDKTPDLTKAFIETLTMNQLLSLYQIWVDFDSDCNPNLHTLNEEEISELLNELKKKPQLVSNLLPWQLRNLVPILMSMLSQYTSALENLSTGSFPDNS